MLGIGDIWTNAATCLECGDQIRSRNRHDFVTCKCGKLSVDGGSWYAKRNFAPGTRWADTSVSFNDVPEGDD